MCSQMGRTIRLSTALPAGNPKTVERKNVDSVVMMMGKKASDTGKTNIDAWINQSISQSIYQSINQSWHPAATTITSRSQPTLISMNSSFMTALAFHSGAL